MMDEVCSGPVLLVGDGDFSFSVSLLKNSPLQGAQVTSSNLETEAIIQQHRQASDNMAILRELGATVLLEVDARELHTHTVISQKKYDRIIFNFPLADRHNIKKNRALVADFFASCGPILAVEGQVMMTLCKGQGGTPADQPMRSWPDSWQVVAVAANSSFILRHVIPFDPHHYPEYHSVGFRFQDKSFNTSSSLTHIFEKVESVSAEWKSTRDVVQIDGKSYSSSRYIAEKIKRNFLQEPNHPVHLICNALEKTLSQSFGAQNFPSQDSHMVLNGYRSLSTVTEHLTALDTQNSSTSQTQCTEEQSELSMGQDELVDMKERKNAANLIRMKENKPSSTISFTNGDESLTENSASDSKMDSRERAVYNDNGISPFKVLLPLLPSNPENVYVLIKPMSMGTSDHGDVAELSELTEGHNETPVMTDSGDVTNDMSNASENLSNQVYHLRTSLLETLVQLLDSVLWGVVDKQKCDDGAAVSPGQQQGVISSSASCLVSSGQCFLPCDITPSCLPPRHELLFVQRLHKQHTSDRILATPSGSSDQDNSFHTALSSFTTALQNSGLCLNILPEKLSSNVLVSVHGTDQICEFHSLKLESKSGDVKCWTTCGYAFPLEFRSDSLLISLLHLDRLACSVCNITDPRLLWSIDSPRLARHMNPEGIPCPMMAVCLYPMKYTHDISFWELEQEASHFEEAEMLDLVRSLTNDLVVSLYLLDSYTDPNTGCHSRCYRLCFLSHDRALAYSTSWKLQSYVRLEIARKLKVTLR